MVTVLEKNKSFLTKRHLHTAVLNPQGSKQLIKKMVPMSISFILHQRAEFAEKDFQTRTYNGIQYKVFKPNLQNVNLQQIRKWVNGALEALDKNYLRELYLILGKANDPNVIFESYKFQFKYMGDDAIDLDMPVTEKNLVESTDNLLKAIDSLQIHTKHKEEELDIKLGVTYYEDVTPPNYNPPCFTNNKDSSKAIRQALQMQPPDYLLLGCLKTGHHTIKCRGKGELFSMNRSGSSLNLTNQQLEESIHNIMDNEEHSNDLTGCHHNAELQTGPTTTSTPATPIGSDLSITSDEPVTYVVNDDDIECCCKVSTSFKYIDQITCSQCFTVQHCACLGYLSKDTVPYPHVCEACSGAIDYTPIQEHRKKLLCTYRLAVAVAYFSESFPTEVISELTAEMKEWAVTKLKAYKVVKKQDGEYVVNMKVLTSAYIGRIFGNSFSQKRKLDNPTSEEEANKIERIGQKNPKLRLID